MRPHSKRDSREISGGIVLKFSNLWSLSRSQKSVSIIKDSEAVIQKICKMIRKSFNSCRYVKIHETCRENAWDSLFLAWYKF